MWERSSSTLSPDVTLDLKDAEGFGWSSAEATSRIQHRFRLPVATRRRDQRRPYTAIAKL